MKKILSLALFLIIILQVSATPCLAQNSRINYDLIYKETPVLDFMYESRVDPGENTDYDGYFLSPYVLIRITDTLINKKIVLKPGYYLVKAENKDGYNILTFKQNGRVAAVVPVYQRVTVNPLLVYPQPITPKVPLYKAIPKKIFIDTPKAIISWPFKKLFANKKREIKLPPQSALESKVVENGKYYEIWLYVDKYLYKALFKIQNNI